MSFLFTCKDTVFNSGLENRVTAIIDMDPEAHTAKIDFISDADAGDCNDHDILTIDELEDGSIDGKIFRITLETRDYFRDENNCDDYDEDEQLEHKIVLTAFAEQITDKMYIKGSSHVFHVDESTNSMLVEYTLKKDRDGDDNNGNGIRYKGFNAEIEIEELSFNDGTISGFFNATLYRSNNVNDPSDFVGVESASDVDLFDPPYDLIGQDELGNVDNGSIDSIRIENGVFQRITLINNTSSY